MISRDQVAAAIDGSALAYAKCWKTLAALKDHRFDSTTLEGLATFQHDLAQALVKLDGVYMTLAGEKERLISRKPHLSHRWFTRQMVLRSKYQKAIEEAMKIGKVIGDNFAYLFYMREPELIEKHLQHEGNLHMPAGIGAIGELAFASHIRPFADKHIVIYHGTTTFLRIGDVSFVHLPTSTVTALGELKSREGKASAAGTKQVEISLFLIGDKAQVKRRMPFLSDPQAPRNREGRRLPLPPAREAQLRRQMKQMSAALDAGEPDKQLRVRQTSNVTKIDELVLQLKPGELSHIKIDDGLAIIGFQVSRQSRLSSRLLPKRVSADVSRLTSRSPQIVMEITDKSRRDNSLVMHRIYPRFFPGMSPLFWSQVSSETLRALTFGELYCATWLNPIYIVEKLKAAGFAVTTNKHGFPATASKTIGTGTVSVRAIDSLIRLLTQSLINEAAFVRLVKRMVTETQKAKLPRNTEIHIPVIHSYDSIPPPLAKRHRRRRGKTA